MPIQDTLPPLSLYIHFPWCTKKCPYCDFNSHNKPPVIDEPAYIKALIDDLNAQQDIMQSRSIHSIFLGGGTPSLFSVKSLNHLLCHIIDHFDVTYDVEITMEANPGSLSQDYLAALQQTPINRLSIGVQSFQQPFLSHLGRIHTPTEAQHAIQYAIDAGFSRINIDLMYGLPHQNTQQALHDLQQACEYRIEHLSWYQLTIEPNTYFYHHRPPQPKHDALFDMQEAGHAVLTQQGFNAYEISAYQKNQQQCQHNLNYWQFGDYIGIGAGAHGKITNTNNESPYRYWNIKHPKHYLRAQGNYQALQSNIAKVDLPGEFMMNALRLNQPISLTLFEQRTGLSAATIQPTLDTLAQQDLLTLGNHQFTLTELGQRFCNDVITAFMADG